MGNTIKNYEKKRRKEQKETEREICKVIHDEFMRKCNLPRELKIKEAEMFNQLN